MEVWWRVPVLVPLRSRSGSGSDGTVGDDVISPTGSPGSPTIADVKGRQSPPNAMLKFCEIAFSQKRVIVVFANTHFSRFMETKFYLFAF
jgi:hypothetical protein